ncbi:hypothetical protein LOTGIDRAFT_154811 [Lottia gigantea]|uniref:Uncharacterized protein n=1 Tax=Lottia gigantea TaxID=225164 RepID=V4BEJ6_LOTGI|nr:hypothetical protein LOTGIDRAFT_154811 [Lottia gigantea]ESO87314.1 hypothetical protein LOTGIDRAFT_154811 [Lottia gigantea]
MYLKIQSFIQNSIQCKHAYWNDLHNTMTGINAKSTAGFKKGEVNFNDVGDMKQKALAEDKVKNNAKMIWVSCMITCFETPSVSLISHILPQSNNSNYEKSLDLFKGRSDLMLSTHTIYK